jgi:hypothetical protein
MNDSNTPRKYVLLYCDQGTQTQDDSEPDSDDSEFPPCLIGNSAPLISRSPIPVSSSRYLRGPVVTQDDPEPGSDDSEFPPCLVAIGPPIRKKFAAR